METTKISPVLSAGGRGDLKERDVIWDESEIAKCLDRVEAVRRELLEHEKARDSNSDHYLALKKKLEEQLDLLTANAKQVKGKWVPKEYQKGTSQDKADGLRKHFRRLLDKYLRVNCRPLFNHLNDRKTLDYGRNNRYRPNPRIAWEVQLRGDKTGRESSE